MNFKHLSRKITLHSSLELIKEYKQKRNWHELPYYRSIN